MRRNAFDKDDFKEDKNGEQPIKWLVTQKRRLNSAEPSMCVEEIIHKMMDKIPGRLYHNVQSRMTRYNNFGEFSNIFEEVLKKTIYVKKASVPKREWTKPEGSRPAPGKPAVPAVKELQKGFFRTCKSTQPGHDFKACRLKSIHIIDEEDNEQVEEEEHLEIFNSGSKISKSDSEKEGMDYIP